MFVFLWQANCKLPPLYAIMDLADGTSLSGEGEKRPFGAARRQRIGRLRLFAVPAELPGNIAARVRRAGGGQKCVGEASEE